MNILIWSCFWTFIFLYLFFFPLTERHKKRMLQPSHLKGRREATFTRAQTGEATRQLPPKDLKRHPECSMVESTSQEQTLTSDQVQEESECGQLTQDVSLEPWDLSPGPSTNIAIVDVKSPDASHSDCQSEPEEEESIQKRLVCASHDLPQCTIGRMSADMLHCLKVLEQIKEATTALQRRIIDCAHACQNLISSCLV
ncbi:hypothetical protein AB205_0007700 [Aquarana catesbeiana]|uniref:Uncharacterized protein n=1 Tax=Aquarana catesbeiana TaxID=8400 RepID=A0A2G9S0Z7_AQUCT|nr:hypothetical protein AB205_0007700 [Aquarana catesbeiana]